MRLGLLFPWLLVLAAPAQTDYFYSVGDPGDRDVKAVVINSQSFRALPESPYPMEFSPDDVFFSFAHSVTVSDPGPFLYASRQDPSQIYGYRRLLDGHLEALPGFPINVQPRPPGFDIALVWMALHPTLPVLYTSNAFSSNFSMFRIEQDGGLSELPESPFPAGPTGPQALALTPDGKTAFFNTFLPYGIFAMDVDAETGAFSNLRQAAPFARGRCVAITDDGRFLYATAWNDDRIYGYSISSGNLTPLEPFTTIVPVDLVWIFIRGRFISIGGFETMKVGIMIIGNDGSLTLAPGSPVDIYSLDMIYSAFSADGSRIFYGGNTYNHAFDLDQTGRLTLVAQGPIKFSAINYGVSASTETVGDPFNLSFGEPPEPGDQTILISGDPDTPFYLKINGVCEGPHSTGSNGRIEIARTVTIDQEILILAYCDESQPVGTFRSVPVLGPWGQAFFAGLLALAGVWVYGRNKPPRGKLEER